MMAGGSELDVNLDGAENPDINIEKARNCSESLALLLESQRPPLTRFASQQLDRRIVHRVDPADVVQQVFLDATQGFNEFRGENLSSLRAWLRQITITTVQDLVRKHIVSQKRSVNSETNVDDSSIRRKIEPTLATPTPRSRLIAAEKTEKLEKILLQLPESQREAVRLRYFENLPVGEIAARLGKSLAATAGLLKRGLKTLREKAADDEMLS